MINLAQCCLWNYFLHSLKPTRKSLPSATGPSDNLPRRTTYLLLSIGIGAQGAPGLELWLGLTNEHSLRVWPYTRCLTWQSEDPSGPVPRRMESWAM